jgi:hypothetical protein
LIVNATALIQPVIISVLRFSRKHPSALQPLPDALTSAHSVEAPEGVVFLNLTLA